MVNVTVYSQHAGTLGKHSMTCLMPAGVLRINELTSRLQGLYNCSAHTIDSHGGALYACPAKTTRNQSYSLNKIC
jgi:hypothetical protein